MESIDVVKYLSKLQTFHASKNLISDVKPFAEHPMINLIDLNENQITDIESISVFSGAKYLRNLSVDSNPFTMNSESSWSPERDFAFHRTANYPPSWRLYIIYMVQTLAVLNNIPVTPEEKVGAVNAYKPPTEVSISIQHMNIQKLNAQVYQKIRCEDLLQAERLKPIVLFGPKGAGKRYR